MSEDVKPSTGVKSRFCPRVPRFLRVFREFYQSQAYPERMPNMTFERDNASSRYTMHRDGVLLSALDFRDDGRVVTMTRAFTVPTFRGHGYAADIVEFAVSELEKAGDRSVMPMCWYVAEWFETHPERAGILTSAAA